MKISIKTESDKGVIVEVEKTHYRKFYRIRIIDKRTGIISHYIDLTKKEIEKIYKAIK